MKDFESPKKSVTKSVTRIVYIKIVSISVFILNGLPSYRVTDFSIIT